MGNLGGDSLREDNMRILKCEICEREYGRLSPCGTTDRIGFNFDIGKLDAVGDLCPTCRPDFAQAFADLVTEFQTKARTTSRSPE